MPTAMKKFALYLYVPQRRLERASFEQKDVNRKILDFKDGRRYASTWAARLMARALTMMDLSDTIIVGTPASSPYTHVRRYKKFLHQLCTLSGAIDGFSHVTVTGRRKKVHNTRERELCTHLDKYVHIDKTYFRGKKVIVVDDICTTGQTSQAFIEALEDAGAKVRFALFLAKTLRLKR